MTVIQYKKLIIALKIMIFSTFTMLNNSYIFNIRSYFLMDKENIKSQLNSKI